MLIIIDYSRYLSLSSLTFFLSCYGFYNYVEFILQIFIHLFLYFFQFILFLFKKYSLTLLINFWGLGLLMNFKIFICLLIDCFPSGVSNHLRWSFSNFSVSLDILFYLFDFINSSIVTRWRKPIWFLKAAKLEMCQFFQIKYHCFFQCLGSLFLINKEEETLLNYFEIYRLNILQLILPHFPGCQRRWKDKMKSKCYICTQ